MVKAGYFFKCTADGLVYHSKKTWSPVKAMFRRLWYYGSANYYLTEKHPDYVMDIMPRKTSLYMWKEIFVLMKKSIYPCAFYNYQW